MRMLRRLVLIAAVATIGALVVGHDQALATLRLVRLPITFSSPLYVTSARDGTNRLFVVERAGVIKVLQPGSLTPTVFLDITASVLLGGERGLLGLAFHPDYASNRRFFVNYTRQTDGANVIAEYTASVGDPNVANTTGTVILVIPRTDNVHVGGMVEFGADGFLYIGSGDNNHPDRSQDLTNLEGKILRIDVDVPNPPALYSSPATNPFFGPIPGADEIYAYGLRNPYRFSFDRTTNDLYVGDVGQEQVEEVDIVTAGNNYGWWIWEGSMCSGFDPDLCIPDGYVFPITEYTHQFGRCSVIGGYVYRGPDGTLPLGTYVFGDLCTGEVFALQGGTVSVALQNDPLFLTSFGENEAGELFVVGFGADTGLHRLIDVPPTTERDFNLDDRADILWRNTISGSVALWFLNGTTVASTGLAGGATADWQIAGVGDFDGDGRTDLLWRHNSGTLAIWFLDGTTITGTATLPMITPQWQIVSVDDFDGDGKADLLWRHTISGIHTVWVLDGAAVQWTGALTPNSPGADWQIVGTGDFNDDGKADLLWRHSSGQTTAWLMNANKRLVEGTFGVVGTDWQVERTADFNGDGTADILWRHTTGTVSIWLLDGVGIIGAGSPGSAGSDWHVVGAGDVNGDGKLDILWRHDSGSVHSWLMNGTAIAGTAAYGIVGADWQIH
jgi:hypothetical protein